MDSLSRDASVRIERYNAGREPERLALKYRAMCKSPFAFFRGTAHLFWEDVAARRPALPHGPLVWASGDLHFENFGSFQGDNGLSYFDLNDFDEGALAPATWEVARFVASAYVAAPSLDLTRAKITELVESFLDAYQTALGDGKARWVERATATGMVRTLLRRVSKQTRAMLLNSRTTMKKGRRRILIDGRRTLPITESRRTNVTRQLDTFAKSQPDPDFFKVLDVARRVAAIQQRMQAIAPALLHAKKIGRGGYVLHELQPTTDRLTLDDERRSLSSSLSGEGDGPRDRVGPTQKQWTPGVGNCLTILSPSPGQAGGSNGSSISGDGTKTRSSATTSDSSTRRRDESESRPGGWVGSSTVAWRNDG